MRAKVVTALLLVTALYGCGPRYVGYGVPYWAEAGAPFETGQVLPVLRESQIQDLYFGPVDDGKNQVEIQRWRLSYYKTEEEAAAFADRYARWVHTYGYSAKRGLPVREAPDPESKTIYKLDENQVAKILSRSEGTSTEGPYENYWFELLTRDGFTGYCFGQFLEVFETQEDPFEIAKRLQAKDTLLDGILSRVWRPEYFFDMITDGRFDMQKFRTDYGLFPQPDERSFRLTIKDIDRLFEYDNVTKRGAYAYIFEGADLRIEVITTTKISLTYQADGKPVTGTFLALRESVAALIQGERQRRLDLYEAFRDADLSSSAYGSIAFGNDMVYEWLEFEKLAYLFRKPQTLNRGKVDFRYYIDPGLQPEFAGVITFVADDGNELSFLYRTAQGGITFVYLEEGDFREKVAVKRPVLPLVLYFEVSR